MRPRVLLVGRGPYRLPLDDGLARRFGALDAELDWRQLAAAAPDNRGGDPRFALARPFPVRRLDGLAWHLALPFRIARELRRFDPDVALVQGAQETSLALLGRRLAGSSAAVILDLHGDWRAPTRLYGSALRRILSPLGDLLARTAFRRADGVRTITGYTTDLARAAGVEPLAEFPAYMDFAAFTDRPPLPLPASPSAVFVGALERTKAVDVLAEAWRRVARRVPSARLQVVGTGALADEIDALRRELPNAVVWTPVLAASEVARALDAATVFVLPSRTEGMGRVVVEAFCRGRGVVGSRTGGIPDLVRHGENGLLVEPGDAEGLADAIARVLTDTALAQRLSAGAAGSRAAWLVPPDEFARRLRALVEAGVAVRRP